MAQINMLKLCKEGIHQTTGYRDIPDDHIKLDLIKMAVENFKWTPVHPVQERQIACEANITTTSGIGNEPLGLVHASICSRDSINVKITHGIIKGLNRHVKLPLKEEMFVKQFGMTVNVNPSESQSHINNQLDLGLAMEQNMRNRGATAMIRYKTKECKRSFECKIVLEGKVLARIGDSSFDGNLSVILKRLKTNDLEGIKFNREKVEIQMLGEMDFQWESDHTVVWQGN